MTSKPHGKSIFSFDLLRKDASSGYQTARFGKTALLNLAIGSLLQVQREFPPVSVDAERSGNFAGERTVMDDAGMKML